MNRSIGLLFALAAIVTNVGAMSIKMHAQSTDVPATANSSWKTHTAFDGQISKIIEGDRYVYVFAHQAYYHKDPDDLFSIPRGTVIYIDKRDLTQGVRGLFDVFPASGGDVRILDYNPRTKSLWICYNDGGIDVFEEESGSMRSIADLKTSSMSSYGSMGTVSFDLENDVWIAMDRGYVRIDGNTFEVKERGYYGTVVESICRVGDKVVALMDNALYEAPESADRSIKTAFKKHDEFNLTSANRIMPISSGSFATLIDGSKLSLASWRNENIIIETKVNDTSISNQLCTNTSSIWDGNKPCQRNIVANKYENNFIPVTNGYLVFSTNSAYFLPLSSTADRLDIKSYKLPMTAPYYIGTLDFDEFWFYDRRNGFYTYSTSNQGVSWSAASDRLQWTGPVGMELTDIDYSPITGVMVMNKNSTPSHYTRRYGQSPMLLSGYKNGKWMNYSPIYGIPRSISQNSSLAQMFNNEKDYPYPLRHPTGFVVDPLHPEYVIVSSIDGGVIAMNTKDIEGQILRFTDAQDPYRSFPGYMANFSNIGGNRYAWCRMVGVDSKNTIWISQMDALDRMGKGPGVELLYWTPENRNLAMETQDISKANKWGNIFFPLNELGYTLTNRGGGGAALRHPHNKNKIAVISNNPMKGIVICDHNGTLENTSDDSATLITKVETSHGLMKYNGWIMEVAEDPLTGNLWMSFDSKLVSIDLSKPVKDGVAEGEPLYVTNMDGSRESTVMSDMVHCIAFDEYNRMWVGTGDSGVYGISTDRKKVFAHYDMSNSPLKSNQIDGLCWDPESHELMIGSDMGLLSVKPDKAGSTVQGIVNPMAYPVNVLPEYKGTVKFVNLPVQTVLTVCDGTGRHIKQLPAVDNGQTIWDVCDADGQPVSQGVYTVRDVARQVSDFRIIVTR